MKDVKANTEAKRAAGIAAAQIVETDMLVGLGTGSTAAFAIEEIGRRAREEGLRVECVATSFQARMLALQNHLRLVPLESISAINLSIDGADEIDPWRNLIKGGGAAHTMEKIVHSMSQRFIVVADPGKKVNRLGEKFAVPIEVLPEALGLVRERVLDCGAREVTLRMAIRKDGPVISDNGNLILDARFHPIEDPEHIENILSLIPGMIENGIFSYAKPASGDVIIGNPEAPDGIERL